MVVVDGRRETTLQFIGIDPGSSGAVAVLEEDGSIRFHDTPTLIMRVGKAMKHKQDVSQCALLLSGITSAHRGDALVTIERVAPMPHFVEKDGVVERQAMGVTSAFTFGEGLGMWQGICAGLLVPFQMVAPATWKRAMMPGMNKEKDASRQRVMQLYPQCVPDIARKRDHARADALLIAAWAKKEWEFYGAPKSVPQAAAVSNQEDLPF